jgi:NAD(P)H-dependent FMN reductase
MKIAVVIGSTRPGRITERVATWVAATAATIDGLEPEVVDLADYPMDFFNEAVSPRYNPHRTPDATVQKWLDTIASYDGYIFVTPEYNHAPAAVLKNAIDNLTFEMMHKPATIVSHGSVGGARAAEQLKLILLESQAAVIPQATALVNASMLLDENGVLDEAAKTMPYGPQVNLESTLKDLQWYATALSAARAA